MEVIMNKEQFDYWRSLPETIEILKLVESYQRECGEMLAMGNTLDRTSADKTAMVTAELVGKIQGLGFILGIDYKD